MTKPIPQEIIDKLNRQQRSGQFHPLTCGNNRTDEAHTKYQAEHGGDFGELVATPHGWICPVCGYFQEYTFFPPSEPYEPWNTMPPQEDTVVREYLKRIDGDLDAVILKGTKLWAGVDPRSLREEPALIEARKRIDAALFQINKNLDTLYIGLNSPELLELERRLIRDAIGMIQAIKQELV